VCVGRCQPFKPELQGHLKIDIALLRSRQGRKKFDMWKMLIILSLASVSALANTCTIAFGQACGNQTRSCVPNPNGPCASRNCLCTDQFHCGTCGTIFLTCTKDNGDVCGGLFSSTCCSDGDCSSICAAPIKNGGFSMLVPTVSILLGVRRIRRRYA
jgi:hypothetical protein